MDKKISAKRAKKQQIVANLSEKVTRAKGLVFTKYQGLSHKQIEDLKKKVKALDSEFVVTKNTLLKLALGKLLRTDNFKEATATLFIYGDPILPLKELAKRIKELNLPVIKFGILEGRQTTSEELLKLSLLPTREVLLTQLVFGLKAPIYGLNRALNWNLQKFVMTLKSIESKKGVKS